MRSGKAVVSMPPMKFVLQVTVVLLLGWALIHYLGGSGPMVSHRTPEAIVQQWQN